MPKTKSGLFWPDMDFLLTFCDNHFIELLMAFLDHIYNKRSVKPFLRYLSFNFLILWPVSPLEHKFLPKKLGLGLLRQKGNFCIF